MIMKKLNLDIPVIVLITMILFSCEKDYTSPKKVEVTSLVSFSHDIVPILANDCAKSGCHITGAHTPDLTAANAYNELTLLGYVDQTNPEGSTVYKLITSTSSNKMPPNGSLTPEEIGFILAWIKQGAQNN